MTITENTWLRFSVKLNIFRKISLFFFEIGGDVGRLLAVPPALTKLNDQQKVFFA
jgi:hypothetical protein